MINTPRIQTRPDHPDFVDWSVPISDWTNDRLVDMPEGIHRHPVVFVAYREGVYAIKELRVDLAKHEFDTLRAMEDATRHIARAVGFVERPWVARDREWSGAVITAYVPHAFPYRNPTGVTHCSTRSPDSSSNSTSTGCTGATVPSRTLCIGGMRRRSRQS